MEWIYLKSRIIREGNSIKILLIPEEADNLIPSEKYRMMQREFTALLPTDIGNIHPDLIALVTLLVASPFVGNSLEPPLPVSSRFHLAVNSVLSKYKLSDKIDSNLAPREAPSISVPMLAFSGGVDSTAALSVMPKNTIPVFLDRPLKGKSLYNSQAAKTSVEYLSEIGYNTQSVSCDLEYIRHPVGFPTDMSVAVPALLLSDHMRATSISFGTVMEAAFRIGHERFNNYPTGSHYTFYSTLFNAVGLFLSMPMAGVSEVGTSIIVEKSSVGFVAQSCIRGTMGNPCMMCWKCFRKDTLGRALGIGPISSLGLRSLVSREVRSKLLAYPIGHENVVSYSLQNYPREDLGPEDIALFEALLNRVRDNSNLDLLTRWYEPSKTLVEPSWREKFILNIQEFLEPMTPEEISAIESWSMRSFLAKPSTVSAHYRLEEILNDINL